MGRITKNNCDYFPHFTTMRNHRKVKALRNKFGQERGYAFWSMFIEYLTELDGNEMEYCEREFEMFAGEMSGGISAAEIQSMVDFCISIELLFHDSGFIYSESLNKYLSPVYEKRQREKEKSKTRVRGENGNFTTNGGISATVNPPQCNISATEKPQSKVKESKVKESKVYISDFKKSLHKDFCDIHSQFYKSIIGEKYNFIGGKDGKAIKLIIDHVYNALKEKGKEQNKETMISFWDAIFKNYDKWSDFNKKHTSVSEIYSRLSSIIQDIKTAHTKPKYDPTLNVPV